MNFFYLLLRRTTFGLFLLLAVIVLNFFLINLAPGTVVDAIIGDMGGGSEELVAELRELYGLDKPLWEQLFLYVSRAAVLDLGYSYYFDLSVTELILERLPATLLLVFSAQFLSIFAGTVMGVWVATRPQGILNHLTTFFALMFFSSPVFWTGLLFILLFAWLIPIFPVSGMENPAIQGGVFHYCIDVLHHLCLPTVALATIFFAVYSRLSRASMLDVLSADYIRTARAKGLPEYIVIYKHALRNALLPVVTTAGLQFSAVISGALLVETVFSWPGLGTLTYEALVARDTPMILGILFFSSIVVIIANIVTDFTYRVIDPRIKAGFEV